jgi:hypothetical protein
MANYRSKSARANLLRFSVCALLLHGAVCLSAYAQDESFAAGPVKEPIKQVRVFNPRSGAVSSSRVREMLQPHEPARTDLTPVNTGSGIVYTCDSNVAAATCNYLNTTVASYYNSIFTNANANIYIVYGTTGLGSTETYYNFLTYDQYVTALGNIPNPSAIQTSALSAINTYAATPYGGTNGYVEVTVALAEALGVPASSLTGITSTNGSCTPGTAGCYNAVTTITNDPGTPLYYDNLGDTEPSDAYDFYSTVIHETDEVLGTSSCIATGPPLSDGCDGSNPGGMETGTPEAVDLFRYSSAGNLVLDSSLSGTPGPYFSYDGGNTNGANGRAGTGKAYNTLANGDDYADFISSTPDCGTNEAIQDAEGCPGEDAGLTILNDGGGELNILNAVGFSMPAVSVLFSPAVNTLSGSSATFGWTPGSGATEHELWVGTRGVGSSNISYPGLTTSTSESVSSLPTNGETLYVRLYSKIAGVWHSNDYTYTAAATGGLAVLTSPTTGSTLAGSSATFAWSPGTGASEYELWIGTSGAGSSNIHYPGVTTGTSEAVTGLPTNGGTLFVRLWSKISGVWQYNDYTYTAEPLGAITSPAPGSTLTSSSVAFKWKAGVGASEYELWVGTQGVGSSNLNYPGVTTGTTETVSDLPASGGGTVNVRLWSKIAGVWKYNDYTFTAE